MKKVWIAVLILLLVLGLLSACSEGGRKEEGLPPLGKDEQVKIKVMFGDSDYFFREYGNLFATQFPNIEIEIADMKSMYGEGITGTMEGRLNAFIAEQKPDVLMLYGDQFERLAGEGKLLELDAVIQRDEFDTQDIHPAILKLLREQGDGKLYGLAPEFSSFALFFNIDLFKQHGVDLPTDSMSWEEVLETAKRFPMDGGEEARIYGLSMDPGASVYSLIRMIGSSLNLAVLSSDGSQFNIDTDSWKQVFHSAIDAVKSGVIDRPIREEGTTNLMTLDQSILQDLFLIGRSAMAVKSSYEVEQVIRAKERFKNAAPANWGIVTAPVDPSNRNQSGYFSLGSIFAVSASSANPRAAWEFVKYVNGDDFSRARSKTVFGSFLSRTKYNPDKDGRSMEPFYKLDPRAFQNKGDARAPSSFLQKLPALAEAEIQAVLNDKKTVEEALKTIQERGEAELRMAIKEAEPKSPPA